MAFFVLKVKENFLLYSAKVDKIDKICYNYPMSFFENSKGNPQIFWHGTCADFDVFYPLSYFAVDRHISESAEFYKERRYVHRKFISDEEAINHALERLTTTFSNALSNKTTSQKNNKDPNFKIIPVHLKMKNPLQLSAWEFHMQDNLIGLVWGLLRHPDENCFEKIQDANATGDFIFKDSQTCPHDAVQKELKMGHLYPVSQNEEENRYHLAAQRFILFLESLGYDGVQYEYMKESVDAYRAGKIKDVDNRAFVTLRPEQVVRLDKKVDIPSTQPTPREKIELSKISYRYHQMHRPYKISQSELMHRLDIGACIKNRLHLR